MQFSPDCLYHIYNRGNDKKEIFFQEKNYSFFLNKLKQDLPKLCDILAYCLRPNQFHLLIYIPITSEACFHYIHQNPFRANLVSKIEGWPYSSFQDYLEGESNICNIAMARELLEIPAMKDQFYNESYLVLDHDLIKNVY